MSISIYGGRIYDDGKGEFMTCPYNTHEYCRRSCAMLVYDTDTEGRPMIQIGCGKNLRREHITKEVKEDPFRM